MNELRRDATTGAWVLIAPERSARPQRTNAAPPTQGELPEYDPKCPFCPGNEGELAPIVAEWPGRDGAPWQVRVVENKYPAVRPCEAGAALSASAHVKRACGRHEVVVETPLHCADPSRPQADVQTVLEAYRQRCLELIGRGAASVLAFRNHGGRAGASMPHPHSQILALDVTLPRLEAIAAWSRAEYERRSVCVTCEMLAQELRERSRIVEAGARYAVLVPYAAASPCELWIVPRRHASGFTRPGEDLTELARMLRSTLRRIANHLDDPPYNYVFESFDAGGDAPWLHWRLRIVPRLGAAAGFEIGSGIPINPSRPEDDAQALRGA